jgi:hypothetical protein
LARRPTIPVGIRRRVAELDGQRCAYCRSPMVVGIPMVVEHVVPLVGGGTSTVDNLCLSCYRCNEFKGPRQAALDAVTSRTVPLFHPRQQHWTEHFSWEDDGVTVHGVTPSGRATLAVLRLNNPWLIEARRIWVLVGLQPPLE